MVGEGAYGNKELEGGADSLLPTPPGSGEWGVGVHRIVRRPYRTGPVWFRGGSHHTKCKVDARRFPLLVSV